MVSGQKSLAHTDRRVALPSKPSAGSAALPLIGECVPAGHQLRSLGQRGLEPPEGTATGDRSGQSVGEGAVVEVVDEPLHVPVAVARPLTVNPQPALVVFIVVLDDLPDMHGVVDRGLRPHLTSAQIDATATFDRVPSRIMASSSRSTGSGRSIESGPLPRAASRASANSRSPERRHQFRVIATDHDRPHPGQGIAIVHDGITPRPAPDRATAPGSSAESTRAIPDLRARRSVSRDLSADRRPVSGCQRGRRPTR